MRFIHTSDWHLGRTLYNRPLLEDQRDALDELVNVAWAKKVDAMVIAGDIFDRSNPPGEAIELFDSVLTRLKRMGIKVLFIAGNHDGAQRIDYGRQLMEESGIYTRGIDKAEQEYIYKRRLCIRRLGYQQRGNDCCVRG